MIPTNPETLAGFSLGIIIGLYILAAIRHHNDRKHKSF